MGKLDCGAQGLKKKKKKLVKDFFFVLFVCFAIDL